MGFTVLSTSPSFGKYVHSPIRLLQDHECKVAIWPSDVPKNEETIAASIGDVDAVVVGLEPFSTKVIQSAQRLKIIAKHGAGLDNIDVAAATRYGIAVTSAAGLNANAVAELTLALILAVARRIPKADQQVRNGAWGPLVTTEVAGKCLGVIGTGRIGRLVASRGRAFDMTTVVYDTREDHAWADANQVQYMSLEDLLTCADFVTIHVPSTNDTRRLLDRKRLSLMKPTAYLINTARGDIVDEEALADALIKGKLAGAGLDVFEREPPHGSRLLALEQVVVTPHMGAYTYDALEAVGMAVASSILAVLGGRRPDMGLVANPEVFETIDA